MHTLPCIHTCTAGVCVTVLSVQYICFHSVDRRLPLRLLPRCRLLAAFVKLLLLIIPYSVCVCLFLFFISKLYVICSIGVFEVVYVPLKAVRADGCNTNESSPMELLRR